MMTTGRCQGSCTTHAQWGAVVLGASFTLNMLIGGVFCVNGLLLPSFQNAFQSDDVTVTWLVSLQVGLCLCTGLVGGVLIELYGCRAVTFLGCALAAVGYITSSFTHNLGVMFLSYSILPGVGLGLQYIPCLVVVQYYFEKKRTLAAGIVCAGSSTGVFIYSILCAYMLQQYGYRGTLLLNGGVILHGFSLGALMTIHPKTRWRPSMGPMKSPDIKTEKNNALGNTANMLSTEEKALQNCEQNIDNSYINEPATLGEDDNLTHFNGDLYQDRQKNSNSSQSLPYLPNEYVIQSKSSVHFKNNLKSYSNNDIEGEENLMQLHSKTDAAHNETRPVRTSVWKELSRTCVTIGAGVYELRDPVCLMTFLCKFCGCFSEQVPYIFLPLKANLMGFQPHVGAFMIALFGMGDTFGRIFFGWVGSLMPMHAPILFSVGMLVAGLGLGCVGFADCYESLASCTVIAGVGLGGFVSLSPQTIIELLGFDKVARFLGLMSLSTGIAFFISPPMNAYFYSASGNIAVPFFTGGLVQITGAMILLVYRLTPFYASRPGVSP